MEHVESFISVQDTSIAMAPGTKQSYLVMMVEKNNEIDPGSIKSQDKDKDYEGIQSNRYLSSVKSKTEYSK